jgi:hypothetical protein
MRQAGKMFEMGCKINKTRLKTPGLVRVIAVVVFLVASVGQSLAQGLGGLGQLGQLLGGSAGGGAGASRHQEQDSDVANVVSVERDVAPFLGKFAGKQKAPSYEGELSARFACYPARDAALPQTRTFVCYTAEEQPHVGE